MIIIGIKCNTLKNQKTYSATKTSMRSIFFLSIVLLIGIPSNAQEKKWTLQECVRHALENNISIKQSELDVSATDIDKLTAIGNFIPNLNGNGAYSINSGASINPVTNAFENETFTSFTTGFNTSVTLFDGLRNIRTLQRAKISKLASEYRLDKMKDDISLLVANAYLNILNNKANLQAVISQNEVTLEQIQRTNELVDAGVLPRGDLLEIEATNASERQRIVAAENAVTLSRISLAQLLLVKDYANFDIASDDYEIIDEGFASKPVTEIIASAQENRSEVKIAQENVLLAKKDLQIARGAYYPTIAGFFRYSTRYTDNDFFNRSFTDQLYQNDGTGYGLQLNVPILNGFATRGNVKRNIINLERTKFQLEQAKLDLESTVYQAYVDANAAMKSYEAALASLQSQELAYQYAKDRYDVGLTNAFDFSQSKLRYDNAVIESNRTKYDYIFKTKVLELYFGVPAAELKF